MYAVNLHPICTHLLYDDVTSLFFCGFVVKLNSLQLPICCFLTCKAKNSAYNSVYVAALMLDSSIDFSKH